MKSHVKFLVLIALFFGSRFACVCSGNTPQDTPSDATRLSVPLMGYREYPADRPKWLERLRDQDGIVVVSDAYETADQADIELDALKLEAAATLVDAYVQSKNAGKSLQVNLTAEQIHSWLVRKIYHGEVISEGEILHESAAELAMSEQARNEIDTLIHQTVVTIRAKNVLITMALITLGLLVGGVMASRRLVKQSMMN